jgi:Iap family predicted aminopeptidase
MIVRNEDYRRLARLSAARVNTKLRAEIVVHSPATDKVQRNVLADVNDGQELCGTILIGAHLDSWHISPGATDNAVGVGVVRAAGQILRPHASQLRRKIALAFWSGEEQGMLGSFAFTRSTESGVECVRTYVNVDGGTGRIRRVVVRGGDVRGTLARLSSELKVMPDLEVFGLRDGTGEADAGSDNAAFQAANVQTITFDQDPIQYRTLTWHTEVDSLERVLWPDAHANAAIVALIAYSLAQ